MKIPFAYHILCVIVTVRLRVILMCVIISAAQTGSGAGFQHHYIVTHWEMQVKKQNMFKQVLKKHLTCLNMYDIT